MMRFECRFPFISKPNSDLVILARKVNFGKKNLLTDPTCRLNGKSRIYTSL
jgi:hypothetical protein